MFPPEMNRNLGTVLRQEVLELMVRYLWICASIDVNYKAVKDTLLCGACIGDLDWLAQFIKLYGYTYFLRHCWPPPWHHKRPVLENYV